jgi:hypothetical protein
MSTNKLFIVCPFSNVEGFLRYKFGPQSLFATAMAGIPATGDAAWLESLTGTMLREGVTELYLVQDLRCRFAQAVLEQDGGFGTHCEAELQNVVDNCRDAITAASNWSDRAMCFAREILAVQTEKLTALPIIQQNGILVRGIITDKGADALWVFDPASRGSVEVSQRVYSVVA